MLKKNSLIGKLDPLRDKHYRDLRKKHILRLSITYLAPFLLLLIFLNYEYIELIDESENRHILSVAESQSRILDIYLQERLVNLMNIIDGPYITDQPDNEELDFFLKQLKKDSDSFIDLGFFDSTGIQISYAGPLKFLEKKDYSKEKWFINLLKSHNRYVITDIYLGLRKAPHFTIAVKREINGNFWIFKSSLDPAIIYRSITSFEKSQDVNISIINAYGEYQLVREDIGNLLEISPFAPPFTNSDGIETAKYNNHNVKYAYSWLTNVNWAVIVFPKNYGIGWFQNNKITNLIIASVLVIILLILIIIFRSKKVVEIEYENDIVKVQLEQASKLVTIGELAAGIAHEIGNPLNIIANEVGIMQDYANPRFNVDKKISDLNVHFDKIMKAVFRCKEINKKLLTFVRKHDFEIKLHNVNEIIEDFISGFFEHEMLLKNIKIIKDYATDIPEVMIDHNQFRQVIVNLLNNAADAITPPGTITVKTSYDDKNVYISVVDTGSGISKEHIDKIFLPFFTTKPVGKGTGLGLSVSYSIIKNFGGTINVESILGKGTNFTIVLPRAQ